MSEASDAFEVEPMKYVGSTVGNAFFSGLTMEQLFECVCIADDEATPEAIDAAVSARIRMNELMEKT